MSLLIAPLEALTDPRLTDTERRVLLALYSFRNKHANTVWPSLEALAERALIKDVPRVSKITGSLAEKGWLTKRKRGFTGCNIYSLTELSADESIDDAANLAEFTKLGEDTNTNLAEFTKSNLAKSTKYRELQIEDQIEQQNKQAPPIGSDPVIDPPPSLPAKRKKADNPIFSPALMDIPEWLDGELWAAWCEERAAKRKPITYRAGQLQLKKLAEYREQGFSPQDVIEHSIASGYQGLFPPRGNQHANNQSANQPYSVGDRVLAAISKNAREREQRQNMAREWRETDIDGTAMDPPF